MMGGECILNGYRFRPQASTVNLHHSQPLHRLISPAIKSNKLLDGLSKMALIVNATGDEVQEGH